jgi:hypothetical protein
MIWDRVFGTYAAETGPLRYGIPNVDPPTTALGLYVDPWKPLPSREG